MTTLADRETLRVEEAATILGIGRSAAYDAIHRGEIPVLRIGRKFLVPKRLWNGSSKVRILTRVVGSSCMGSSLQDYWIR